MNQRNRVLRQIEVQMSHVFECLVTAVSLRLVGVVPELRKELYLLREEVLRNLPLLVQKTHSDWSVSRMHAPTTPTVLFLTIFRETKGIMGNDSYG
ncbi:hypothetical protein NPIL_365211 [Nephila pilipes]|uniref:Uncharacterized protein n=1 Tax=Nephila pilipes TaxID=299642 RepID=A0A8X6USC0_NEPPI|nr:hypothetical protein NPIL_365211 [Nephila pilipes]